MTISKESVKDAVKENIETVKESVETVKNTVTQKVAKDTAALKEVVVETTENIEKLSKETKQKVTDAVAETSSHLKADAEHLNEQVKDQVQDFKQDITKRLDVIKNQFATSQKDFVGLAAFIKAELSLLIKELTVVGKEIRVDVSQISEKHKVQVVETLKRSKDQTLEVWNKVTAK